MATYVRYIGEGSRRDVHCTVQDSGTYRVKIVCELNVPAAVPDDIARELVTSGEFEEVDPDTSLHEIAEADRARDAENRVWRNRLKQQQAVVDEHNALRVIVVGREQAEVDAYQTTLTGGGERFEAVAAARQAGSEFMDGIGKLGKAKK